jgi:hypothetical protein
MPAPGQPRRLLLRHTKRRAYAPQLLGLEPARTIDQLVSRRSIARGALRLENNLPTRTAAPAGQARHGLLHALVRDRQRLVLKSLNQRPAG